VLIEDFGQPDAFYEAPGLRRGSGIAVFDLIDDVDVGNRSASVTTFQMKGEPTTGEARDGSVKNLGRYAASGIAWWPKRPSSTAALT